MEKRWNVYHHNEFSGLKTAREIRDGLRQGSLDPFDKVALEGSNIREDLIEVDEIFNETSENYTSSIPKGNEARHQRTEEPLVTPAAGTSVPLELLGVHQPQATEALTNRSTDRLETKSDPLAKTPTAKRYLLLYKNKILGPLSAPEIQSLFSRGIIDRKTKVQKIGTRRTMTVPQFIATFTGDRLKELSNGGKLNNEGRMASPSSRVMNELTRMVNSKKMARQESHETKILVTALVLFFGMAAFYIYESRLHRSQNNSKDLGELSDTGLNSGDKIQKGQRLRLISKQPNSGAKSESPNIQSNSMQTSGRRIPPPAASEQHSNGNFINKNRKLKAQEQKDKNLRNNPSRLSVASLPLSNQSPVSLAIPLAGRIQTVGPLSFALPNLEACESKCKLTFNDSSGRSLQAVFFKSAYFDQLRQKSKGVTLVGSTRLERGQLLLFIQDVY